MRREHIDEVWNLLALNEELRLPQVDELIARKRAHARKAPLHPGEAKAQNQEAEHG